MPDKPLGDELKDLIKKANERDSVQAFFEWGLQILREMIECQSLKQKP